MTGALNAESARGLVDVDGVTLPDAMGAAGADATHLGADVERGEAKEKIDEAARIFGSTFSQR